ncbi:hypothetical protein BDM02DRAFT_1055057 [Thelephora ganbajun]|uniref:Uncharacterized protein n=1 Tax=Thelephora ganbajun TaxID=370292 RepID=A0ACB6Z3X8_THEGA|nr:hypothetical protein BDM02DRAFT_1055057 [Thelephora ganbajun]
MPCSSFQDGFSLMYDSVRLFVEERDSLQLLPPSPLSSCDLFTRMNQGLGSFSYSFLSAFRDDFPKLSVLHFQFLAEPVPQSIDLDSPVRLRSALNDALCIVSAANLDTINVPILPQPFWKSGRSYNMLQSSALVSIHIESVTLPMRLKRGSENMSGVLNQPNWRNDTPFVQLSGIFPVESGIPLGDGVIDFSAATRVSDKVCWRPRSKRRFALTRRQDVTYSRRGVTRGFSPSGVSRYEKRNSTIWSVRKVKSTTRDPTSLIDKSAPVSCSGHTLVYPLPTSFPRSIIPPPSLRPGQPKGLFSRSPSTTVLSSLTTTTHQLASERVRGIHRESRKEEARSGEC